MKTSVTFVCFAAVLVSLVACENESTEERVKTLRTTTSRWENGPVEDFVVLDSFQAADELWFIEAQREVDLNKSPNAFIVNIVSKKQYAKGEKIKSKQISYLLHETHHVARMNVVVQ